MIRFIKKLVWLVKHQEQLEKLLKKPSSEFNDGTFSLVGVPNYQKEHIKSLLAEK